MRAYQEQLGLARDNTLSVQLALYDKLEAQGTYNTHARARSDITKTQPHSL